MNQTSSEPGGPVCGERGPREGRGGGWVVAQSILMAAVLWVGWQHPGAWGWAGSDWLAVGVGLLGAYLGIAGAVCLGRGRTIFPEPPRGALLVESGIYRRVRHPLYASVMLLSVAWACWRNSQGAMVLAAFLAGFLTLKANHEEKRLCRRFPHYRAYRQRTARFFPGLW